MTKFGQENSYNFHVLASLRKEYQCGVYHRNSMQGLKQAFGEEDYNIFILRGSTSI